jgi:hypothetical protein
MAANAAKHLLTVSTLPVSGIILLLRTYIVKPEFILRRVTLVLLATVALAVEGHAQGVHFGVKAGASLTTYAGKGTDTFNNLTRFHGGLVLNKALTNDGSFSLQPELLYSQKGAEVEQSGSRFSSKLEYLDLPLLARFNAGGFFVEAGPQLGYLLSHDSRFTGPAQSVKYRKLDFRYAAGLGYQLESGLNAGVRYNGGLSDLFDQVIGGTINPNNSAFQFYVGYQLGGK